MKRSPLQRRTPLKRSSAWETGKPRKPRRKTERQILINKLDDLCRQIVRARGSCELKLAKSCSGTSNLQWVHFIRRRYEKVKWDLRNGFCGCVACHVFAHNNELAFERRVEELIGLKTVLVLKELALRGPKPDLKSLVSELQAQADRITT